MVKYFGKLPNYEYTLFSPLYRSLLFIKNVGKRGTGLHKRLRNLDERTWARPGVPQCVQLWLRQTPPPPILFTVFNSGHQTEIQSSNLGTPRPE